MLQTYAKSLLDIELTARQIRQFDELTDLLLAWNQRMNLTAITDPVEIAIKHYLDSLTLHKVIQQFQGMRLIDVGTGAGFPGLALAIAFPDLHVTLMDSTAKKLRFLDHARATPFSWTTSVPCTPRAEDAGRHKAYREAYDIVTARAVGKMPALMEYTLPLAKLDGQVVAMKGTSAFEETSAAAKAITTLGGELFTIEEIRLPTLDNPRYLIVVDKVDPTPRRYPRNAGIPTRDPILLNRARFYPNKGIGSVSVVSHLRVILQHVAQAQKQGRMGDQVQSGMRIRPTDLRRFLAGTQFATDVRRLKTKDNNGCAQIASHVGKPTQPDLNSAFFKYFALKTVGQ